MDYHRLTQNKIYKNKYFLFCRGVTGQIKCRVVVIDIPFFFKTSWLGTLHFLELVFIHKIIFFYRYDLNSPFIYMTLSRVSMFSGNLLSKLSKKTTKNNMNIFNLHILFFFYFDLILFFIFWFDIVFLYFDFIHFQQN